MSEFIKKLVALFMVFLLIAGSIPLEAFAYFNDTQTGLPVVVDQNGNEVQPNESWEETFPYGTFAFFNSQLTLEENGEAQEILVYRLGGTTGRAEAIISYVPAVISDEDGQMVTMNAISASDIIIEVEDDQPIAQYQPLGRPKEPKADNPAVTPTVDEEKSSSNAEPEEDSEANASEEEDGESTTDNPIESIISNSLRLNNLIFRNLTRSDNPIGNTKTAHTLTNSSDEVIYGKKYIESNVTADCYQWYTLYESEWEIIEGATSSFIEVSNEHFDDYDFRVEYKVEGQWYCSNSVKGVVYQQSTTESLPEMPKDIEPKAEPTYSAIEMEPDTYDGYDFKVVFAEHEWVKKIIITPVDDEVNESDEFGTFTITDCIGGSLYDTANMLTLHMLDDEPNEPTDISFEFEEIMVDKSDQKVSVKIIRTGDITYPVQVSYTTIDNTAVAGKDYAEATGELAFFGDLTELTIDIDLINDGTVSGDILDFKIELFDLIGGGDAECTTEVQTINVSLSDTGYSADMNMASVFANTGGAVDLTQSVGISDQATMGLPESSAEGQETTERYEESFVPLVPDEQEKALESEPDNEIDADDAVFGETANDLGIIPAKISEAKGAFIPLTYDYKDDQGNRLVLDFSQWKQPEPIGGAPIMGDDYWTDYQQVIGRLVEVMDYVPEYTSAASFPCNDSEGYWKNGRQLFDLVSKDGADYKTTDNTSYGEYEPRFLEEYGIDSWVVSSNVEDNTVDQMNAFAHIPYLSQKFSKIYTESDYKQGAFGFWTGYGIYSRPELRLHSSSGASQTIITPREVISTGTVLEENNNQDINLAGNFDYLRLWVYQAAVNNAGFTYVGRKDEIGWMRLEEVLFKRRVFEDSDFFLKIYTANDADAVENIDDPKITELDESTDIYAQIKPTITILPHKGGVKLNTNQLFVGSQLKISLGSTGGYRMPVVDGTDVTYGIALVDNNGNVLKRATESTTAGDYYLDLAWKDMTAEQINGSNEYTIAVIMERQQELILDLTPSVPRLDDGDADTPDAIDPTRINEAKAAFEASVTGGSINIGYSKTDTSKQTNFDYKTQSLSADQTTLVGSENQALLKFNLSNLPAYSINNIQKISFNLPAEDRIVFNGVVYNGDEDIYISGKAFNSSKMVFKYYDSDYIGAQNIMSLTILDKYLYYDANGNGEIDGYFDESTNLFVLEDNKDEFIQVLRDGEQINESLIKRDGSRQYFIKVMYEKTARCLVDTDGTHADDRAQLVPAFTTSITNQEVLKSMAREVKDYRYIVGAPVRVSPDGGSNQFYCESSSDNLLMYGPEAMRMGMLDIPLGGDKKPPTTAKWTPEFLGSLLYDYDNPEFISVKSSRTGQETPIAELESFNSDTGAISYKDSGLENINQYLGSLTADDTFAICIRQQDEDTNDIVSGNLSLADCTYAFEASAAGKMSVIPQADYLSNMQNTSTPSLDFDMDDSGLEYESFGTDFGMELPLITANTGSFFKIITSKNKIAITVGLPDAKDVEGVENFMRINKYRSSRHALVQASGGAASAKKRSFDWNMGFAMLFQYDPLVNNFVFSEFSFYATAGFSFTIKAVFAPCPILYVYFKIGASLTVSTGMTVLQETVEYKNADVCPTIATGFTGSIGSFHDYNTTKKAFNIYFEGKLYLDCQTLSGDQPEGVTDGYIKSDDDTKPVTIILKQQDGYTLSEEMMVRIIAVQNNTQIKKIVPVEKSEMTPYWNGVTLTPKLYLEVGAGIGVELLCFEVYAKASIGCAMQFASQVPGEKDSDALIGLNFGLGMGFRVVVFFFSYSMDFFQYTADYDVIKDEWTEKMGEFVDDSTFGSTSALINPYSKDEPYKYSPGDFIQPPANSYLSQVVYSPEDNLCTAPRTMLNMTNGMGRLAYNASNPVTVPFQISGYSSSGDAFKLADGIVAEYEKQIVTVGTDNYLIYTQSRNSVEAVDASMLVMSKIVLTTDPNSGDQAYGLENPVTPLAGTEYIVLEDDNTGDLSFSSWVDTEQTIHVAFVDHQNTAQTTGTTEDKMVAAAKDTIVTKVSFKVEDADSDGINDTDAFIVDGQFSSDHGSLYCVPDGANSGDVVFFGTSNHFSDAQASLEKTKFADYIDNIYGADAPEYAGFMKDIQNGLIETRGQSTDFNLAVYNGSSWSVNTQLPLLPNEKLDNSEIMFRDSGTDSDLGDYNQYYIAYTATENVYFDANGIITQSGLTAVDWAAVKRAYVREVKAFSDGTVNWGTPCLIRTVVDFHQNGLDIAPINVNKDGVYVGGAKTDSVEDPYFSNLQFLEGKLDGYHKEKFLLLEMNQNTYSINQDSLDTMIENGTGGDVKPFFSSGTDAQGKVNTTIGTDGQGNVCAVYTTLIPATGNNAIYMTKYDSDEGTWGEGIMLAMNYMQVYEDGIINEWDNSELEAAYIGKLSGYANGGMNEFTFSDLEVALGNTDVGEETVLIVSKGSLKPLIEHTFDVEGDSVTKVIADPKTAADGGIYAISFGVGDKSIGQIDLEFGLDDDFAAGSVLNSRLSLMNNGDVALRGSDSHPITIELRLQSEGTHYSISEWKVKERIKVGQVISLEGQSNPLTENIPTDSVFYITVKEDASYATDPLNFSSLPDGGDMTVRENVELAIENASFKAIGLDSSGNTIIETDFVVTNRGRKTADDVFIQFSYQLGEDQNGSPTYQALDISGHALETTIQQSIASFMQLGFSSSTDEQNGIFKLYNTNDGDEKNSIAPGNARRVTGTFKIAPSHYNGEAGDTANLNLEVFSHDDAQIARINGLFVAEHNEYNSNNNIVSVDIAPKTYFRAPDSISVAVGSTMLLPLNMYSALGRSPVVTVSEILNDETGAEPDHFGIKYYSQSKNALVLTPGNEGSGFIRVSDTLTNSFMDIAYTTTPSGDGINIYSDNNLFAFYNEDDTAYDPNSSGDWGFYAGIDEWGTDPETAVPYINNLSKGEKGSYFEFETLASGIDLYFDGTVTISSTFGGFSDITIASDGGTDFAHVDFGDNPAYVSHTVTVKVDSLNAQFDKIVNYFTGDTPTPADDAASPQIFWSRSFPDTASMDTGSVNLTCYVIDESGLGTVTLNDVEPAGLMQSSDTMWQFDMTITQNTELSVTAIDTTGKTTSRTVVADWFNNPVSSNTIATAPELYAEFVNGNGESHTGLVNAGNRAYIDYSYSAATGTTIYSEDISVYYFNAGDAVFEVMSQNADGKYEVTNNGQYCVTVMDSNGKYASVILDMVDVDAALPSITLSEAAVKLTQSPTGKVLKYFVSKIGVGTDMIDSVTLNGQSISIPANIAEVNGEIPILFNGEYIIMGTDTAGNSNSTSRLVADIAINTEASGVLSTTASWIKTGNGTLLIDDTHIFGGKYDESVFQATDTYLGDYEYMICGSADAYTGDIHDVAALSFLSNPDNVWSNQTDYTGLLPDTYTIYTRDAQDPGNQSVLASKTVTVADNQVACTINSTDIQTYGGSSGEIEITASNGSGDYKYSIDGGSTWHTRNSFTSLSAGIYEVLAVDDNNDLNISEMTQVWITDPDKVTIINATITWDKTTKTGSITLTASGGKGTYEFSIDGGITWQTSSIFTDLVEGKYKIIARDVTDIQNESDDYSVRIKEPQSVKLSATYGDVTIKGGKDGWIKLTAEGGSGHYEFSIDNGKKWYASGYFSGLIAKSYYIYVRDQYDHANISSMVKIVIEEPEEQALSDIVVSINKKDVKTLGGQDGAITVTAEGGSGSYQFRINSGRWQTSNSFAWLRADDYIIEVRDETDYTHISEPVKVTITEPGAVSFKADTKQPTTTGARDGVIIITAKGGNGEYEYSIDGGISWQDKDTFSNLPVGIYHLAVRDKADFNNRSLLSRVVFTPSLSIEDKGKNNKQTVFLEGMLFDSQGNPVKGYTLIVFPTQNLIRSDVDGKYKFEEMGLEDTVIVVLDMDENEVGRYQLTFEKGEEAEIRINDNIVTIIYNKRTQGVDILLQIDEADSAFKIAERRARVIQKSPPNLIWLWLCGGGVLIAALSAGLWFLLKKKSVEISQYISMTSKFFRKIKERLGALFQKTLSQGRIKNILVQQKKTIRKRVLEAKIHYIERRKERIDRRIKKDNDKG